MLNEELREDLEQDEQKKGYLEQLKEYQTDEFALKRAYQILKNEELTEQEHEEIINFIVSRSYPKCSTCNNVIEDADIFSFMGEIYCPACFGRIWEKLKNGEHKH